MAFGALVADLYVASLAGFEAVFAEGEEDVFFWGLLLLVHGDGAVSIGVMDGDGDVVGAVGEGSVGDGDAIFAGFG